MATITQTKCSTCFGCNQLEVKNFKLPYECKNYIDAYQTEETIRKSTMNLIDDLLLNEYTICYVQGSVSDDIGFNVGFLCINPEKNKYGLKYDLPTTKDLIVQKRLMEIHIGKKVGFE